MDAFATLSAASALLKGRSDLDAMNGFAVQHLASFMDTPIRGVYAYPVVLIVNYLIRPYRLVLGSRLPDVYRGNLIARRSVRLNRDLWRS